MGINRNSGISGAIDLERLLCGYPLKNQKILKRDIHSDESLKSMKVIFSAGTQAGSEKNQMKLCISYGTIVEAISDILNLIISLKV